MSKQDQVRKAYYKSFSIEAEKQYLLHNRTPNRIWIEDPEFGDMCLPPWRDGSSMANGSSRSPDI